MPERKHTCAVMVETKMAWNYLRQRNTVVFPRLGYRDYSLCDKVVFYNHQEGRVLKADMLKYIKTTILDLTGDQIGNMGVPSDLNDRLEYFKEFFGKDDLEKDTKLTLTFFQRLRGKGVTTNWHHIFSGGKE